MPMCIPALTFSSLFFSIFFVKIKTQSAHTLSYFTD